MINLVKLQELKIAMYKQLRQGQISESTLINRMEIKDEQMMMELRRLSALLCVTCDEIGRPDSNDLTVELGVNYE